jgi:hypothetical protein
MAVKGTPNNENIITLMLNALHDCLQFSAEQLEAQLVMVAAQSASVLQRKFNGVIKSRHACMQCTLWITA